MTSLLPVGETRQKSEAESSAVFAAADPTLERRLDGAEAEERMFCWEAVPPSMISGVDLT